MPAYDKFHESVKNALTNDGWTVTSDPLSVKYEGRDLFVDLGAERVVEAEKDAHKIAIEIKTFAGRSDLADLHLAVGQYVVYRSVLAEVAPDRELWLVVSEAVYQDVFRRDVRALMRTQADIRIVTFDPDKEEIIRWQRSLQSR